MLKGLTHAMQIYETGGGGGQWWETIAAFNCEAAAIAYGDDCQQANPVKRYRTISVERNGAVPPQIFEARPQTMVILDCLEKLRAVKPDGV